MIERPKAEAARIAAREALAEATKIFRAARDDADRRGTVTVDKESATIFLDGEIAPDHLGGVDAPAVRDALASLKGRHVTLRLNTPGGSVDDGLSIFNALKSHKGGLTTVGELCASMGSLLLQAGDRRIMTPSGLVMLHAPWSIAIGGAAELERRAAILRKYGERLIPLYATRTGKPAEDIREMFLGEHWFNAEEAVTEGFACEVAKPKVFARAALARARMAVQMADTMAITAGRRQD